MPLAASASDEEKRPRAWCSRTGCRRMAFSRVYEKGMEASEVGGAPGADCCVARSASMDFTHCSNFGHRI
jgi:hypothetical protein